ncbi:SMI1/KNR4 family protein [Streptomyces sp. NPDC005017]|uniref:SMI1/KNR4 family protein n=1 Tax=Streptomyces sp. NPDC005017 TaxID=3364706 RepID=UPI0036829843
MNEVFEGVRLHAAAGSMPAPATLAAVTDAEEAIGFSLPPLLRRLYLEVANGGFGPDDGVLGVTGGAAQGDWNDLAEIYRDGPDPSGRVPAGVVPLYDWGDTVWSMVDFRDPAGPMWCTHDGDCWPQGINLAQWLAEAMEGTLTVESILSTQPTTG